MDDVFAVALQVKTLALELNTRRAVEQLRYDRHITTLSCVLRVGLVRLPGEPVLSVYVSAGGVADVAMARAFAQRGLADARAGL